MSQNTQNLSRRAVIYLFSGSGNTRRIARLYSDTFLASGVETLLYEVKDGLVDLPNPNDFDLVGFAYPIHAFNAPKAMLALSRALPPCSGGKKQPKPIFIIKSSGEPLRINNISSLRMRGILSAKGYKLFAEYHYVMPYNMIFRHSDTMATRMWHTAKELAPIEAAEVLQGKTHFLPRVPFGHLLAWVLRIEHPAMRVNGHFFRVDPSKCIHCNKCVRACPMGNITVGEDGKFTFGNKCLMCTACSFGCPTDAFSIGVLNHWRVNGSYNTDYAGEPQPNPHAWYCRKAYARYFAAADAKIEANAPTKESE